VALAANSFVDIEVVNLQRIKKDIYRLQTSEKTVVLRGQRIVRQEVDRGKRIMTESIQNFVYAVPQKDLSYARTRELLGSVRSRDFSLGMAAGEIYIDPSVVGKDGYFYPLSAEYGLTSKPAYYGRHYFEQGKAACRVGFRERATSMAKGLLHEIIG
jgi:hypothetical protein